MNRRRPLFLFFSIPTIFLGLLGAACESEDSRPPFRGVNDSEASAGGASAGSSNLSSSGSGQAAEERYPWCSETLDIDTSDLCDDQTTELGSARPNLYFILDTSGSMAGRISSDNGETLLDASRQAIFELIEELGGELNYGIATYPGELSPEDFGCAAGEELISPLADEDYCEDESVEIQFSASFRRQVNLLSPMGGTPLSPTLNNLKPKLLALQGPTTVVLLTDGAPNCNSEATCEIEDCLLPTDFFSCGPQGNCCSAEATSEDNPTPGTWCVDENASVSIVAELAEQGIETRVIGIPGAQEYEPLMNALAQAGGAARVSDTEESQGYFDVADSEELLEALRTIGEGATTSCDIELDSVPTDLNLLNVYVNNRLVGEDAENGWQLDDKTIRLQGDSCMLLREGGRRNIRIVVGCPTIIR